MQVFVNVQQIFPIEFTKKKGTKKQGCYVIDDAGERAKVSIYPGNNPELEQFHINQRLEFNLSAQPNQNKPGEFYYGGFWECANPQQVQQPPQGYQPPPQAPQSQAPPQQNYQAPQQQAPPRQNDAPAGPPALTPKDLNIMRQLCAKVLGPRVPQSIIDEGGPATAAWICEYATPLLDWIATGQPPMSPAPGAQQEGGEQRYDDQGNAIPF